MYPCRFIAGLPSLCELPHATTALLNSARAAEGNTPVLKPHEQNSLGTNITATTTVSYSASYI